MAALPFGLVFGTEAIAHEVVSGVSGFPALILHPVIIPDFLLCLIAAALLVARATAITPFAGIAALSFAIPIGLLAQNTVLSIPFSNLLPLSLAGLTGLVIALVPGVRMLPGLLAILLLGGAVGLGIFAEGPTPSDLFQAMIAAMISGAVFIVAIGWPLSKLQSLWGKTLIRVAGAWIAAIAMMVLAFDINASVSAIQ